MKKLFILGLMSLACSFSSHAVTLICEADTHDNFHMQDGKRHENTQSLFVESIDAGWEEVQCGVLDVQKGRIEAEKRVVTMKLKGAGLGLRYTAQEAFMINCPLVLSKEKLIKSPFYGVKASVGAIWGASAGVFSNKRLGVCIMTSISGGTIGVGLSGAKLTFED